MKATLDILLSIAILICLLSFACCNTFYRLERPKKYTDLDSIWLPFENAMESKNINFLVQNSLDSVRCCECNIDVDSNEYFNSEFIFTNHLDKIMHLKSLSNRPFSLFQVDSITIKVGYSVKSYHATEGAYGLFFTLIKKDGIYWFQGMIVQ